ncbi:MAG: HAMP domain-containing histidine kinase [Anaerolineaceae bacterium]|nr:HAMP domain-containing histidine kinase [Anaerolineaceae bacterium]
MPNSIRWRLPLSYAAIALVAVLSLGLVLLTILRSYYARQELTYLAENAQGISLELSRLVETGLPEAALQAQLQSFSFLTQTRVRWLDTAGQLIADSGEPHDQHQVWAISVEVERSQVATQTESSPGMVTTEIITQTLTAAPDVTPFYAPFLYLDVSGNPTTTDRILNRAVIVQGSNGDRFNQEVEHKVWFDKSVEGTVEPGLITQTQQIVLRAAPGQTGRLPPVDFISTLPTNHTPYGLSLNPNTPVDGGRTDQVIEQPVYDSAGQMLGTLELSQGPAYGRDIVTSVAWGWAIAGSAAVVVAAAAGWIISRRLTKPLLALTEVTNQMANGDLSVRADVARRDELGVLAGSFNEMAVQVETTVSTLRRFVADAAHELHTPLTALRTNLELAAAASAPVERPSFLAQAQAQVERLERLTIDLLDLSRLEAQTGEISYAPLDLRELVLAAAEQYASQADQAELTFTVDIDPQLAMVNGHTWQLRRVLDNLLDNALKFTAAGGQVGLGLEHSPDLKRIIVWVADSGIGLVADDLPHLFQRFHRGRNATAYPGSGLGLAIVRAIIEGHGGRVWAEPTTAGARFSFWLPVITNLDG